MISRTMVDLDLARLPHRATEVVVVGAGIAGLYTALLAAQQRDVLLIAKKTLLESNTRYAQGGIAAVLSADDSPLWHRQDTLMAGVGLCEEAPVDVLVHEGPQAVRELIRLGTRFDRADDGAYDLTREGAHSHRRILHARGDATGAEIIRALTEAVLQQPRITVWDEHFCLDVVTDDHGCAGVIVEDSQGQQVYVSALATVLCTGGCGQLYRYTTNPDIATGDGLAMAYRAGAIVRDVEFVQFHPTVLTHPGVPRFLISEAVRGEGALLRNGSGDRFMVQHHPLAELAPRDVVARAIVTEMERMNTPCVYLDMTHESGETIRTRFPTIYEQCLRAGLDMAHDWIPVSPAAHYMMGGIKTDLWGETNISCLFACGEVSSTGVHGANRLASNSLSEALVFGKRIAQRIASLSPVARRTPSFVHHKPEVDSLPDAQWREQRIQLQKMMVRHVGLVRQERGLLRAWDTIQQLLTSCQGRLRTKEQYELANLCTVASLIIRAAITRQESRGAHYRSDFVALDDLQWRKHLEHRIENAEEATV